MSKQVAEIQEQLNWHWRNSMRTTRFFIFDSRAAIPFIFLLFYMRLSTFLLCIVTLFVFWVLEKKGLTLPAALRSIRVMMFGVFRPAVPKYRYRRLKDFGR